MQTGVSPDTRAVAEAVTVEAASPNNLPNWETDASARLTVTPVLSSSGRALISRVRLPPRSGTELFAAEIYFLSQLPAKIDPTEVILTIVFALTLSLLASIYPAWRAARLDPVEVLRYE